MPCRYSTATWTFHETCRDHMIRHARLQSCCGLCHNRGVRRSALTPRPPALPIAVERGRNLLRGAARHAGRRAARVRARRCRREMAELQPGREPLAVTGALPRRSGRPLRPDLGRPVHDPRSAAAGVVRDGHRSPGAGTRSRDKPALGLFPALGAEYRPRPQTGARGSGRRTAHERRAGRAHRRGADRRGARLSDHAVGDRRGCALRDSPVHDLHRFDRHVRCPVRFADRARRMGRGGVRATSQLGAGDPGRRAAGTGWGDQALAACRRRRSQRGRRADLRRRRDSAPPLRAARKPPTRSGAS